MRHSSRQKHLKHVHRSAHIRRMRYFRTVQSAKGYVSGQELASDTNSQMTKAATQSLDKVAELS